jgi:xanthine dehydrogenase/oxidase
VANVPVRNAGTVAGNLMLKHAHPDFPSDLAVTLAAAGAIVTVASKGETQDLSVEAFLQQDMTKKVLTKVELRPFQPGEIYRFVKISSAIGLLH